MKTDDVIVKKSKTHGKGIFAVRDFKKDEILLHLDFTHTLSKEVFKKLSKRNKMRVSFINNKYIAMQSPESYMNHSCEANTLVKDFNDIAIVNIKKGEEITTNYFRDVCGLNFICKCKSKN